MATVMAIQEAVRQAIADFFFAHGISFDKKDTATYTKALCCLFDLVGKRLAPARRRVHYSKELKKSMCTFTSEIKQLVNFFTNKFVLGDSLDRYLSTNIYRAKQTDGLLNAWNIRHLHLDKEGKRADYQLLFIATQTDVYFLDIVKHLHGDEYNDPEWLNRLFKNGWLKYTGAVKCSLDAESLDITQEHDKILSLRKKKFNFSVKFQNGECYMPSLGLQLNGQRVSNIIQGRMLSEKIKTMATETGDSQDVQAEILYSSGIVSIVVTNTDKTLVFPLSL